MNAGTDCFIHVMMESTSGTAHNSFGRYRSLPRKRTSRFLIRLPHEPKSPGAPRTRTSTQPERCN